MATAKNTVQVDFSHRQPTGDWMDEPRDIASMLRYTAMTAEYLADQTWTKAGGIGLEKPPTEYEVESLIHSARATTEYLRDILAMLDAVESNAVRKIRAIKSAPSIGQ